MPTPTNGGTIATNGNTYTWIGPNLSSWSATSNWQDSTAGLNPAAYIPGQYTPVIFAGTPNAAYRFVTGGGTAASLGLTGNFDFIGNYTFGGTITIGSLVAGARWTLIPGALVVASGGTLTGQSLQVPDGSVVMGPSSSAIIANDVTMGMAGGYRIPSNGTYAYTSGASCAINLQQGASLTAGGDLALNAGALNAIGGTAVFGGGATIGSSGTVFSTTPLYTIGSALGRVAAIAGGAVRIAGNVTVPDGLIVADGASSTIVIGGTVTTNVGATYTYLSNGFPNSFSGVLIAINGGGIQMGGLVLNAQTAAPIGYTVVDVDAYSRLEVGTVGNAARGAITIDPGAAITATGTASLYANLVNNGALIINNGLVTQSGDVSGTGSILLGLTGTLLLQGSVAATQQIQFTAPGAVLAIGSQFDVTGAAFGTSLYAMPGLISGFQPGDAIILNETITAAAYTAGVGNGPGTLSLSNGTTLVERLALSGPYAGRSFTTSQAPNGSTVIGLATASTPVATATNSDLDVWIGPANGVWQSAANWRDATIAAAATAVPGALTPVRLAGLASPTQIINGGGAAASLSVFGNFAVTGSYAIGGVVSVGTLTGSSVTPGSLSLLTSGVITAPSLAVTGSTLGIAPGATFVVSGVASAGLPAGRSGTIPGGTVSLGAGATLAAGSMTLNAGTLGNASGVLSIAGTLAIGISAGASASGVPLPASVVGITGGGTGRVQGNVTEANGILAADGIGSTFIISGTLAAVGTGTYIGSGITALPTITASAAALNGGTVQARSAILTGLPTIGAGLSVDAASVLEIGTAGSATPGAITIDPGSNLNTTGSVTLTGSLINNGTIIIGGGTLREAGAVSGQGMVRIANGATWSLGGSVGSQLSILFSTTYGVLQLGTAPMAATLVGFQTGDTIIVPGTAGTLSYVAGAPGLGSLAVRNGNTTVASLTLAGTYAARTFTLTPIAGGSAIGLLSDAGTMVAEAFGGAAISQSGSIWSFNLGAVMVGGPTLTGTLGIANAAIGPAGTLSGGFAVVGSSNFVNTGFATRFTNVAPGQDERRHTIALQTASIGVFTETILVSPVSTSISGTQILPAQTILVSGTVQPPGTTYTLAPGPQTITAGLGDDIFIAGSGTLNSRDSLNGGGGANTLTLIGPGVFDLGQPGGFSNIRTVIGSETAEGTTLYMRDRTPLKLVLSGTIGTTATIYGAADADTFQLGAGSDRIFIGATSETVIAGGGTAWISAPATLAAATILGAPGSTTTLEITTGGSATLAAADAWLTVSLDAAAHLTLGGARFVTAVGSAGSDTIVAGAAGQTLCGGLGSDVLAGYTGFGDVFRDSSTGLDGDVIVNFGGGDAIDITDLAFGSLNVPAFTVSGTIGALALSDGIRNITVTLLGALTVANFSFAADGGGGTSIGFVAD